MNATYNIADDKLRLYCGKVDRETFDHLRAAGFQRAPRQECFYAPWSPRREDLLIEMAGPIDDDDVSPLDRAQDRADRLDTIADNATARAASASSRAHAIMDGIPFGQPILVGHHSERHARRDAERIDNAIRSTVEESRKAAYYQAKAAASLAHAARRERPDVIARRIDSLQTTHRQWERLLAKHGESDPSAVRWLAHIAARIAYETALLEATGGIPADTVPLEVGGALKFIGDWYEIVRVNKKTVTIKGWFGKPDWTYLVDKTEIKQTMTAAEWQRTS